jgi:YidC/Oxa1 family membrane protein insertase
VDRNLLLAFALSFAVLMLWTSFVAPPPEPPRELSPTEMTEPETAAGEGAAEVLPPLEAATPRPAVETELLVPQPTAGGVGERIPFETTLYRMELDTKGAGIRHWELRKFDTGPRHGELPIVLTTGNAPLDGTLATPFDELGFGDLSEAIFELERENESTFAFRFTRDGVTVRKTYVFHDASYGFEMRARVENGSDRAIAPRFSVIWPAAERPEQDFREQALASLHEGSVEREHLQGLGVSGFFGGGEKVKDFVREVDWAGVETTYFISAVLPDDPTQASARFIATEPGQAGVAQVYFDPVQLPPGQAAERVYRGYIGPKEAERLEAMGGGLGESIDVGWSWVAPLTRIFGWLLEALYSVIPNYGLAIIVLTILVRVVTAPLTNKQMRSMERMRALSPKLQELKEKYGDDRQKQSEEMMRLYRQEGVNPLGGCLPMILQLPVFIGLFYALRSSIQLRQAPFVGWIDDLSAPEALFVIPGIEIPFRVLPLVMGGTMLLQQRITPMQQMDPAQQKMMMTMMPIVMTVVFYQFPSGLVLYWMVSNMLAIAHQLWIGRGMRVKPA